MIIAIEPTDFRVPVQGVVVVVNQLEVRVSS